MPFEESTVNRLELLVQRLLDQEVLTESQCAALMDEASSARHLWFADHVAEACRHVERVVLFTEALIQTGALAPGDGREVLEAARSILHAHSKCSSIDTFEEKNDF